MIYFIPWSCAAEVTRSTWRGFLPLLTMVSWQWLELWMLGSQTPLYTSVREPEVELGLTRQLNSPQDYYYTIKDTCCSTSHRENKPSKNNIVDPDSMCEEKDAVMPSGCLAVFWAPTGWQTTIRSLCDPFLAHCSALRYLILVTPESQVGIRAEHCAGEEDSTWW